MKTTENQTTQLELKKTNSLEFVNQIVHEVKEGYINPLVAFASIKELEKAFTTAKREIEELATIEAEKHGSNFEYFDYKVTLKNGGKMYDFKGIPEVESLEGELKATKDKYKAALDGIDKGLTILQDGGFVSADGEILPLPKVKYRKSSIAICKK